LLLALAGPVLFQPNTFVFRDAGHFYYPLFEFAQSEWGAGRVPLWDPYENCGTPLLANPTASIFYPGKLIFALPLPFPAAYTGYILGHLLLAAGGCYFVARRWGASREAAGLAALSYAYSGNVLFQYCNIVFLCGAAWLPLALWSGERLLETRRWGWSALLGAILALMVLAGDPQMAYQAGLLLALYAWMLNRRDAPQARTWRDSGKDFRQSLSWKSLRESRWVSLGLAAVTGALLAAVQILPTQEFNAHSIRAHSPVARSVWELPGYVIREAQRTPDQPARPRVDTGRPPHWTDGLLGNPPPPGGHQSEIYHFSVGPWRLAEFLWPNVSGKQFPVHRRWLDAFPAERSVWVPTQYQGLWPCLLGLGMLSLRKGPLLQRWVSAIILLSWVAGFGRFGLVAIVHLLGIVLGDLLTGSPWQVSDLCGFPLGDEVGGLYWLLTVLLPGYVQFRFPGKWLVVTSLGLSLSAAWGFDHCFQSSTSRWRKILLYFAGGTVVLAGCALSLGPFWSQLLEHVPPDLFFGPLDRGGAYQDLLSALAHALLLALLLWALLRPAPEGSRFAVWRPALTLIVTALEIGWANGWILAVAPTEDWQTRPVYAEVLAQAERERAGPGLPQPFRVHRLTTWLPPDWARTPSPERLVESLRWDRNTLYPKYNLREGVSLVESLDTSVLYDFGLFLSPSVRPGKDGQLEYVQPRRALDAWNAKYFLIPKTKDLHDPHRSTLGLRQQWLQPAWTKDDPQGAPRGEPLPPAVQDPSVDLRKIPDAELLYNPDHLPRAWIVHDLQMIPPVPREAQKGLYQALVFPYENWIDMRKTAVLESQELLEQSWPAPPAQPPAGESCQIVHYDPQQVEIEVTMKAFGAVILSDVYDPGWVLQLETDGALQTWPVFRANRLMRAALLEPGRHRLIYRYRPVSYYLGWLISGMAWTLLVGGSTLAWLRSREAPGSREVPGSREAPAARPGKKRLPSS